MGSAIRSGLLLTFCFFCAQFGFQPLESFQENIFIVKSQVDFNFSHVLRWPSATSSHQKLSACETWRAPLLWLSNNVCQLLIAFRPPKLVLQIWREKKSLTDSDFSEYFLKTQAGFMCVQIFQCPLRRIGVKWRTCQKITKLNATCLSTFWSLRQHIDCVCFVFQPLNSQISYIERKIRKVPHALDCTSTALTEFAFPCQSYILFLFLDQQSPTLMKKW